MKKRLVGTLILVFSLLGIPLVYSKHRCHHGRGHNHKHHKHQCGRHRGGYGRCHNNYYTAGPYYSWGPYGPLYSPYYGYGPAYYSGRPGIGISLFF